MPYVIMWLLGVPLSLILLLGWLVLAGDVERGHPPGCPPFSFPRSCLTTHTARARRVRAGLPTSLL